jgi:four helix bundle protein
MAIIKQFEDLEIWQLARQLCKDIHKITNYELLSNEFRLKEQIRASSGSIMDNIAEGFERSGNKEFIQFLFIAKGSCGEVRSQLYRILDNSYISENEFDMLKEKCMNLSKSISGFISYLKNSEIKGSKYKI